ncbi:hypothetical protein KIL84_009547 [Mauremys mutica]|uniref:Uncharacterized protein n=1 Tax=Mauremys mutica TaxID=74926 RepID=A0A9D3WLK6_9SAUR|nr:hypothetical protein KIL84_009547 [Mauremys mutica]
MPGCKIEARTRLTPSPPDVGLRVPPSRPSPPWQRPAAPTGDGPRADGEDREGANASVYEAQSLSPPPPLSRSLPLSGHRVGFFSPPCQCGEALQTKAMLEISVFASLWLGGGS